MLGESKMESYYQPNDSTSFTSRGTMTFKTQDKECIRVHLVGSAKDETKVMFDIDEKLFSSEKLKAFQSDLDFIFGSCEAKRS